MGSTKLRAVVLLCMTWNTINTCCSSDWTLCISMESKPLIDPKHGGVIVTNVRLNFLVPLRCGIENSCELEGYPNSTP